MKIIQTVLWLTCALVVAAGKLARGADDIPCTQNGYYYAVCPEQPHVTTRLVDGSSLPQPPPTNPIVVDGSKLSPLPQRHVQGVAAGKATAPEQAPAVPVSRKNWRTYTIADWISIGSIFLLALPVSVVFYLVNRTIQSERKRNP